MSTYSHPHHTHSLSYQDMVDDEVDEDDVPLPPKHAYDTHEPNSPSSFRSPPASSIRPPEQTGLQPDPGYMPSGFRDSRQSVGRFMVVEGSPNRGPEKDADSGRISPQQLPPTAEESTEETDTSLKPQQQLQPTYHAQPTLSAAQLAYNASLPHVFYTPHFPSMSINGTSVTLSLAISILPTHGTISISPSANGLEFTPPKLKFTSSSLKKEATFTATPLPTAKEGKVKVCYIISGDDAKEYTEPPSTSFQMYSEDTPLPLPSPPHEFTPNGPFSPTLSDVSESSIGSGIVTTKSDRAAFLASGVPRKSGRFTVIDEESNGSPPISTVGVVGGVGEDPFELLARLSQSLSHLVEENKRLKRENERLVQENTELKFRGGGVETPDNRFNFSSTSSTPTHAPSGNGSAQPTRVATITPQPNATTGGGTGGGHKQLTKYPSMNSTLSRPANSTSPNTPTAAGMRSPQANPSAGLMDKRSTLPANFVLPRGGAAAGPTTTSRPHAGSQPLHPPHTSLQVPHSHSPLPTTSTGATLPASQVSPPKARSPQPSGASSTAPHPSPTGSSIPKSPRQVGEVKTSRRKSTDFAQQIQQNLTASLQASVNGGDHQQKQPQR